MYFKRNKETGIVEVFDDNGNKIDEIITMGDLIMKEEAETEEAMVYLDSSNQQKTRSS